MAGRFSLFVICLALILSWPPGAAEAQEAFLLHEQRATGQPYYCESNGAGDLVCSAVIDTSTFLFGLESGDAADFDGDGDIDAVTAGRAPRICLNDGAGSMVCRDLISPTGGFSIDHVVAADFDSDGDADVVTGGTPHKGNTRVCLNNGAAVFSCVNWNPRGAPTAVSVMEAMDKGDIDGDGDIDVVVTTRPPHPNNGNGFACFNDGNANFATPCSPIDNVKNNGTGMDLADIDGDDDLDAVISQRGDFTKVFSPRSCFNNGSGVFSCVDFTNAGASQSTSAVGGQWAFQAFGMDPGDLDGDGDVDFLAATNHNNLSARCLNNGSGFFSCVNLNLNATHNTGQSGTSRPPTSTATAISTGCSPPRTGRRSATTTAPAT